MANLLAKEGQKKAFVVLLFQSVIVVLACGITAVAANIDLALAVMFGGLMNILPNSVFTLLAFRYSGASHNEMVVRSFSQGTKLKLILTMMLAVIAFYGLNLSPIPLLTSFILLTMSHLIVTAIVQTTTK